MLLKNGLEVFVIKDDYNICRVELVVKAGMLTETPEEHGYAHLVEHLASFYPSSRYPNSLVNQQYFTKNEIECNAWTSPFSTGYYLEGVSKFLIKLLEYMYEHFTDPKWDNDIFPQEITAVVQELHNHKNSTWSSLNQLMNSTDFPGTVFDLQEGYGLDHEIESIENAKMSILENFRRKWYTPCNCVLFITTNNVDPLWPIIDKWEKIPNTALVKPFRLPREAIRGGCYFAPSKNSNYKIVLGFDIPWDWYDPRTYALEYLTMILTDGLGSMLMAELRSSQGLIYTAGSGVEINYYGKSRFSIWVHTDKESVRKVIDTILDKSKDVIPTCDMLTRRKFRDKLKTEHYKATGFRKYSEDVEEKLLWHVPVRHPQEIHDEISRLSKEELREIFISLLNGKPTIWYSGKEKLT